MKKVIFLGGMFLVILLLIMGTTGSYLRSQATSQDNVISTGTVEVVLSDTNETEQVSVSKSWGHLESSAGEILAESEIKIINQGTLNSNHLDITFAVEGDMELAKHILFHDQNGLLLGRNRTAGENLAKYFLGQPGQNYKAYNPIGSTLISLDGNDGTVADGKISLSELHTAGTIRLRPFNEGFPMQAGSQASLWINGYIDPELDKGGEAISTTITFGLEQ